MTLTLTSDGVDYQQNPFEISTTVLNTGTASLTALAAQLLLPPEIELVSASATISVSPSPLAPQQSGTAKWLVHARTQRTTTQVPYRVLVYGDRGAVDSCRAVVNIPPVIQVSSCRPNGVDTKGTDFWTAFPHNEGGFNNSRLLLFISAVDDSRVRIERPKIGKADEIIVRAGTTENFLVEPEYDDMPEERIDRLGVHISSDRDVAVYAGNMVALHSDASSVLPSHALGKSYVTAGYNFDNEFILVVGTQNQTSIDITPFAETGGGKPGGIPFTIVLDQGETFYFLSNILGAFGGLTGTKFDADKPIAVYSGSPTGWIPYNPTGSFEYLNFHYHQMMPDNVLGMTYVTVPFRSRKNGDTFKVVATVDNTNVTIGASQPITLAQRGDWKEFILDEATYLTSSQPVMVAQYANSARWDSDSNQYGDASQLILSPTDRFASCHLFPIGLDNRFDTSFVNLVVPDGAQQFVTLDGRNVPDTGFHAVPQSSFLFTQVQLLRGTHSVSTTDAGGVGVSVYGFEYHDAFAYNSGFLVERKNTLGTAWQPSTSATFELHAPFPNPTQGLTNVQFSLPFEGDVTLALHDVLGREVQRIVSRHFTTGLHLLRFDPQRLPGGVYTVILSSRGNRCRQTLVVAR